MVMQPLRKTLDLHVPETANQIRLLLWKKKQYSPILRSSKGPQADESKLWAITELDPYLPTSRSTCFEIYMCSEKEGVTPFYQTVHIVKMALLNTFVDNLPQDLHFMTTYKSLSEK